jgi:hypothetical protein
MALVERILAEGIAESSHAMGDGSENVELASDKRSWSRDGMPLGR